jgi:GNAT superfamily N-acetyltransferase
MDLAFREYKQSDFSTLVEMVLGLYTKDGTKATQMSAEKIALSIEPLISPSNPSEIIIFEANGETIGYCILNRFCSNEYSGWIGYVDELFIQPNHRSSGIGEQFFMYLEQNSKYKFVAFMLETVENNPKATRFYQRIGFELHHNLMLFKQLQNQ